MYKIAKTISQLVLLSFLFLVLAFHTNASTLFYDSGQNNPGMRWSPNGWFSKTGYGTYSNDGVVGPFDYFKDFNKQNIIIKFDLNIHDAKANTVFGCRANSDYSTIEQSQLTGNGNPGTFAISNATECILNNCYGTGTPNPYIWPQTLGKHKVELACINSEFTLKYDDKFLASGTISNTINGTGVRLEASGGSDSYSNIYVCDAAGCDPAPTPTSTPTPIPTQTPTPTPAEINLNVPLLKQTSDPWQSLEYDTAKLWAPNNFITIRDWGCALTSAVMVLQYNGITKMPDNSPLTPGTLNAWLKSQPDGYVGNGWVNWLAIPRLTRLAKLAFNNPNFTSDALVYKRLQGNSISNISNGLKNGLPSILEEPGHFIVAKGTQQSTFTINDPLYNRTLLTDTYNNSYIAAGTYIPSNTDLSYIMLAGPETLSFNVKTATGSSVGEEFIQQPFENDNNPSQKNGSPIKIFYNQQPLNDTYQLTVSGQNSQSYEIKGYLYDIKGNVKPFTLKGIVDNNHSDTFSIQYNKENQNNERITKQVTIASILFELDTLFKQKDIQKGLYAALRNVLRNAQKAHASHNIWREKFLLNTSLIVLNAGKNWGISQKAYQLLYEDISLLKSSL